MSVTDCGRLRSFLLSKADSNHHKQNQNLLCYHYTIGQSEFCRCKISKNFAHHKLFCRLFHNQQIIILLTLLCQQVLAVNQVFSSDWTILVGELLLIQ